MKDILRASVISPAVKVADTAFNLAEILKRIHEAKASGSTIALFPELSLTGYTCGDLFLSETLLDNTKAALSTLADEMPEGILVAVGAPLEVSGALYNCAVLLSDNQILGAVPKTFLQSFGEAAEKRYFASGADLKEPLVTVGAHTFPVSTDLLVIAPDGTTVGVEICEDLFSPLPPSSRLALSGAEIILNLAASNELVGKRAFRRDLVRMQSKNTLSAYLFAGAGVGESGADLVFAGHSMIALDGKILAENKALIDGDYALVADLDLGTIRHDRRKNKTFSDCKARFKEDFFSQLLISHPLATSDGTLLSLSRLPFVPDEKSARTAQCMQIFEMQAAALARRLPLVGGKLTIGISGGLDSTLALLVAIRAMERLSLPRTNIIAITMPCFGTSDDTLANSLELMEKLGVTSRKIPIGESVLSHFRDIGHDPADYSTTYENAQARERTQVLMDVANKEGGIVLGTGDLSEMALGWCTYNGDHMSMYGVNADVPKTLVRWIIESIVEEDLMPEASAVLVRVLDTPISPELLPPDAVGKISQKTEDIVGPYALHDFFLYYAVRYQYRPAKIFALAVRAFEGIFDGATVKKWLTVFWRRFFTQQFKRNCVPDGVKVGSVGLSPRGDWQMPSDASFTDWMREIEQIEV